MQTLTLSYVVKGPLVVLEEWVAFDLIHSSAAQTNLPAHSNRTNKTVSRASSVSTKKHPLHPPPSSVCHPKHTSRWRDHKDQRGEPQNPLVDTGASSNRGRQKRSRRREGVRTALTDLNTTLRVAAVASPPFKNSLSHTIYFSSPLEGCGSLGFATCGTFQTQPRGRVGRGGEEERLVRF